MIILDQWYLRSVNTFIRLPHSCALITTWVVQPGSLTCFIAVKAFFMNSLNWFVGNLVVKDRARLPAWVIRFRAVVYIPRWIGENVPRLLPSLRVSTSSIEVESPHISLCLPGSQTYPRWLVGILITAKAAVVSKSSSFTSPLVDSYAVTKESNPKSSMEKFRLTLLSASSFAPSIVTSHDASSAVLLSASLNALISASLRSSATKHGTASIPSSVAARSRVWPPTTSLSLFWTIGTLKPNRIIYLATAFTAASLFLGLFL